MENALTAEESSLLVAAMIESRLRGGTGEELAAIAALASDPGKLREILAEGGDGPLTTKAGLAHPRVKPSPFGKK